MKKKIISFILAALTAASALSFNAFAYTNYVVDEIIEEEEETVAEDDFWDFPFYEGAKFSSKPDLTASKVGSSSAELTFNKIKNTETVKFYYYDNDKEKYVLAHTIKENYWDYQMGYVNISGLDGSKTYKVMIKYFNAKGKEIAKDKISFTTIAKEPILTIKNTGKKAVINVKPQQKNASGYEVYYKKSDGFNYPAGNDAFNDYSLKEIKNKGFKLLKKSSDSAKANFSIKVKTNYTVIARTYSVNSKGKKVYSGFTIAYDTLGTGAYINNIKLNPQNVTSGDEQKLVKKYVNSVVKKGMSNEQKLYEIFNLVHSHGKYQNDINKIDGNRPVWQIMEKGEGQCASWAFCLDAMLEYAGFDVTVVRGTRPSGQHFWCQIEINGDTYDLDAHLGDYLVKHYGDYHSYTIVEKY